MAKIVTKGIDAPAKNDVYVGMLLLTVLATCIGIACLALELDTDYQWESVPKGGPAIQKKETKDSKSTDPKPEEKTPPKGEGGNTKANLPDAPTQPAVAVSEPMPTVTVPVSTTIPDPVTPPLALPTAPPTPVIAPTLPAIVPPTTER